MSDDFWLSLWNPESYLKLLLLIFTYPLWGPIVKIMWEEFQEAMAPEGGVFGRREKRDVTIRPPGLNPWLNVPLARHRSKLGGAPSPPRDPRQSTARAAGAERSALRRTTGAGGARTGARPTASAGPRRRTF